MIIKVTNHDINNGTDNCPLACPIAIAASRAYGTTAEITPTALWVGQDTYRLPTHVQERIRLYDATQKMEPFIFTVTERDKFDQGNH